MSKSIDLVCAELAKLCITDEQPENYNSQEISQRPPRPRLRIILPPSHKPFAEFTLFNQLPRELRNLVWEFAAFQSRSVKISHYVESWTKLIGSSIVPGQTRHPGLLQTNHEAREEGLRYYTQCREAEVVTGPLEPRARLGNFLFVNFAVDKLVCEPDRSNIDGFNLMATDVIRFRHVIFNFTETIGWTTEDLAWCVSRCYQHAQESREVRLFAAWPNDLVQKSVAGELARSRKDAGFYRIYKEMEIKLFGRNGVSPKFSWIYQGERVDAPQDMTPWYDDHEGLRRLGWLRIRRRGQKIGPSFAQIRKMNPNDVFSEVPSKLLKSATTVSWLSERGSRQIKLGRRH